MVFQVTAEEKAARFEFTLPGSRKKHSLPKMDNMPFEAAVLFEQEKSLSAVLAAADDDELRDGLKRLTIPQVNGLVEAWVEFSQSEGGADLGE